MQYPLIVFLLISRLQSWKICLMSYLLIIFIEVCSTEPRPTFWPCFSLLMQSSFWFINFCIPVVRWCSFDHLLLYSEECGCIFPFCRAIFERASGKLFKFLIVCVRQTSDYVFWYGFRPCTKDRVPWFPVFSAIFQTLHFDMWPMIPGLYVFLT